MALGDDVTRQLELRAQANKASVDALFESVKEAQKNAEKRQKELKEAKEKDLISQISAAEKGMSFYPTSNGELSPISDDVKVGLQAADQYNQAKKINEAVELQKAKTLNERGLRSDIEIEQELATLEATKAKAVESLANAGQQARGQALIGDLQTSLISQEPTPQQIVGDTASQLSTGALRASDLSNPQSAKQSEKAGVQDIPFVATKGKVGDTTVERDPMVVKQEEARIASEAKAKEEEQKSVKSAQKSISGTGRMLKQFGRSYKELKEAYPDIGKEGYVGFFNRLGASIETSLDKFPETKAFQRRLEPVANQMARDIEGGKITDQDRQIYADSFFNVLKGPSETNVRLASESLIDAIDKGADVSKIVNELASSDIDLFQNIIEQVREEYPDKVPDRAIDAEQLLEAI